MVPESNRPLIEADAELAMTEDPDVTPSRDRPRRPVILTMRGTEAWKAWIDRLARHCRLTTSTVIDQALVRYAEEVGFEEPPPQR